MEMNRCMRVWVVAVAVTAMCVLAAAPVYAASLYDDAVSYWNFGTNADPTLDSEGSNNGTVSGATWTSSGKVGGAYGFNGVNNYINVGTGASLKITGQISLAAWIKPNTTGNADIIAKWGAGASDDSYILRYYNNKAAILLDSDGGEGGYGAVYSINDVSMNSWSQLVGTWNGSTMKIYLNGVEENSAGYTAGIYPSTATTWIGRNPHPWGPFSGSIDEVAIWSRALGSNEIDALYKTGFISSAMSTLSLNYTTDQINQLAYLYLNQADPVTIGDSVWSYVAHNDPIWDGHRTVGATFNVGGVNYLYLGGGISQGPLGGGVPEPSSMAVSGIAIGLLGLIKKMRRKPETRD